LNFIGYFGTVLNNVFADILVGYIFSKEKLFSSMGKRHMSDIMQQCGKSK
jgi:hypothetical protein